jgi:hypothetical protein
MSPRSQGCSAVNESIAPTEVSACDLTRIESCGGQLTVGAMVRKRLAERPRRSHEDHARPSVCHEWEQWREPRGRKRGAHALAGWQLRYPNVDVRRLVTRDDPVKTLLNHSRHAQLVVVGDGRRSSSVVVKPFDEVSSAVAQACRIPVIVGRRKPSVCQPETIDDGRKPGRPRQIP